MENKFHALIDGDWIEATSEEITKNVFGKELGKYLHLNQVNEQTNDNFFNETEYTFESNSGNIKIMCGSNTESYNIFCEDVECQDSTLEEKINKLRDNQELIENDYDNSWLSEKLKNLIIEYENNYQLEAEKPEAEKVFLATTAKGVDVYIEKETFDHMQAHPDVDLEVVKEAISKIDDITEETPFRIGSTDIGRIIGKDSCVEINPLDNVQNLYRKNRDGQTPVIINGEKEDTSLVTVGICIDEDDNKHTMFTAFYGQLAPKEPWDKNLKPEERAESEKFWSTHALAVEPNAIDWERNNFEEVYFPYYRYNNKSFMMKDHDYSNVIAEDIDEILMLTNIKTDKSIYSSLGPIMVELTKTQHEYFTQHTYEINKEFLIQPNEIGNENQISIIYYSQQSPGSAGWSVYDFELSICEKYDDGSIKTYFRDANTFGGDYLLFFKAEKGQVFKKDIDTRSYCFKLSEEISDKVTRYYEFEDDNKEYTNEIHKVSTNNESHNEDIHQKLDLKEVLKEAKRKCNNSQQDDEDRLIDARERADER